MSARRSYCAGELPPEMGKLKALEGLDLSDNRLEGMQKVYQ